MIVLLLVWYLFTKLRKTSTIDSRPIEVEDLTSVHSNNHDIGKTSNSELKVTYIGDEQYGMSTHPVLSYREAKS